MQCVQFCQCLQPCPQILGVIWFMDDTQCTSKVKNVTWNSHSHLPHQVVESNFNICSLQMYNTKYRKTINSNYTLLTCWTAVYVTNFLRGKKKNLCTEYASGHERTRGDTKRYNGQHFGRQVKEYMNKNYQWSCHYHYHHQIEVG